MATDHPRARLSNVQKVKGENTQSKAKNYGAFKPTDEVYEAWEKTKEIADTLNARVIVFQCPASFEPTTENKHNLMKFFSSVKRDKYLFAWEPRGKWNDNEVKTTCRELNLVHCVDPFKSKSTFGKIRYYRLHGIGGYRYKYTQEDLGVLKEFVGKKIDSYVMFNNVFMYDDALAFKKLVSCNYLAK